MPDVTQPCILPTVGMSGVYTLLPPFNAAQSLQRPLTCIAVRALRDYLSDGADPLSALYTAHGLTEADYTAALARNQPIITLQADTGFRLEVPSNYIARYPDTNGVSYATYVLATNIGAVPLDSDLSALQAAIADTVYDHLGVTPEVDPVVVSHTVLVPHDDHATIVTARNHRRTHVLSNAARCQTLQVELAEMRRLYRELEAYVLSHHVPTE